MRYAPPSLASCAGLDIREMTSEPVGLTSSRHMKGQLTTGNARARPTSCLLQPPARITAAIWRRGALPWPGVMTKHNSILQGRRNKTARTTGRTVAVPSWEMF